MAFDLTTQKILITQWFNNVLDGKQNDEILFLERPTGNTEKSIHELLGEQNNYKITSTTAYTNHFKKYENKNRNIILFQSINEQYISELPVFRKMIHKIFLLVPKENNFLKEIKNDIDTKRIQSHSNTYIKEERYLYYFEKVDPLDLILNNTFELKSFIHNAIIQNLIFWKDRDRLNLLIYKTSFKRENYTDSLSADILLLIENKILTSRLAVVVYRIANLNLSATTTEAGRYFHKKLGSKSKTSNYNLIIKYNRSDKMVIDLDLRGKNFKAYDLTINESEITIRREIAKNLVCLKEFNLDANTISSITKLPLEEVEKLKIKFP